MKLPPPVKRIVAPSRAYTAQLSPGAGSRWDSSHAMLELHDLTFGSRIFGWHGVWSPCSHYFAIGEWLSVRGDRFPDMQILLVDVLAGKENAVERISRGFVEPMLVQDGTIKYTKIAAGEEERILEHRSIAGLTDWKPVSAAASPEMPGQISRNRFPVSCSCGMTYTYEEWLTMRYDGIQTGYDERTGRQMFDDLEMRRCLCGSSMTMPVRVLRAAERRRS